jgi:predicted dehydrogenase
VIAVRPLKVGVVGLGVGEQHVIGYQAITGCEVVAVCDIDAERVKSVADRRGIAERYTDARRVTEHPCIDVVSICSYDDAHAKQVISALRAGKHVMVEKPLTLYREDAEEILRAQQESGRIVTSNLILRHSPRFREVRRMIRAGEFGDIFYVEGDYIHQILRKLTEGWRGRMDFYCVTYGGGIHLIDLMRWLLGQEVTEVTGMGTDKLTAGGRYRYPDTIVNLLRFAGGALAKTLTTLGPQRPQIHALNVYGTRATFVNDMPNAKIFSGDSPEAVENMSVPYPAIQKGELLPDFIGAVREGREPEVSSKDVFRVMDICFAAWESVQSKRAVQVSYMI